MTTALLRTGLGAMKRAPLGGPGTDSVPANTACSVGVMVHDEAANLGRLLDTLLAQPARVVAEVLVVLSGCTDGSVAIAQGRAERDERLRLLVQPAREGKASAVNLFLAHARQPLLVLCSADLLPAPDALEKLLAPFAEPEVGMTACRPVPVDDPGRFLGFAAHLLWTLHHRMNEVAFKAGEMIAFRRVFQRIPYRTSVDEASIEPVIRGQGYRVCYVGSAIAFNKGPETVKEFLAQRRRIHAGHLALRHELGYRVATLSGWGCLRLLLGALEWRPRAFCWAWAVAALEAYGRWLGRRDYQRGRDHTVWEMARSTKNLEKALTAPAATEVP